MKKIIGLMILLISALYGHAQFPTYPTVKQSLGSKSTIVYSKGMLGADSGYVQTAYPDTATANLGYIKNIAGTTIRVVDKFYMRNDAATKWIEVSATSGGGGGGPGPLQDVTDLGNTTTNEIIAGGLLGPYLRGGTAANGDLLIEGTSHATKATSYVHIQPTGGNVGIGLFSPDSSLTVNLGAWIKRGFRLSGLSTGVGTKALRIDNDGVVSIADTTTGGGGSITLSAIGSTPNANGATLTGSALNLEPASASFGGVVTTGTQTIAGRKTLSSTITSNGDIGTYINSATVGMSSGSLYGMQSNLTVGNGAGSGGTTYSAFYRVDNSGASNKPDNIVALATSANHTAGSGTLGNMIELQTGPAIFGGGITTNLKHIELRDAYVPGGTGDLTNQYGLYINNFAAGTNNYSIYSGTAKSYFAGQIGIGNASPAASSILDLTSTTKGLLVPRMSRVQIAAISSPATGLLTYDNAMHKLLHYNSSLHVPFLDSLDGAALAVNIYNSNGNLNGNRLISGGNEPANYNFTIDSIQTFTFNAKESSGGGGSYNLLQLDANNGITLNTDGYNTLRVSADFTSIGPSSTDNLFINADSILLKGVITGSRTRNLMLTVDSATGRVMREAIPGGGGGSGTVTSASIVTANGFAGTTATSTTTPAHTITTTVTGMLKGNGTAISAATAGTDYMVGRSTQTHTSGATVTVTSQTGDIVFYTDPASLLASETVTLPATPVDKQVISFKFGGTITTGNVVATSFTLSPNSGQSIIGNTSLTDIESGDGFSVIWKASNSTWYR